MVTIHAREMPLFADLASAPSAADYGIGPAWIGGIIFWSDGSAWLPGAKKVYDLPIKDFSVGTVPTMVMALRLQAGVYFTLSARLGADSTTDVATLEIRNTSGGLIKSMAHTGYEAAVSTEGFVLLVDTDVRFYLVGSSTTGNYFINGVQLA